LDNIELDKLFVAHLECSSINTFMTTIYGLLSTPQPISGLARDGFHYGPKTHQQL